jgi:hypothetical protein
LLFTEEPALRVEVLLLLLCVVELRVVELFEELCVALLRVVELFEGVWVAGVFELRVVSVWVLLRPDEVSEELLVVSVWVLPPRP